MKKYRVVVVPEAQAAIREAFAYIHERAPRNAERWLHELYRQIDTLEQFPERCAPARERKYLEESLCQLVFKSYRIVFQIVRKENTVYVLSIRHARRRAAGADAKRPES